MSLNMRFGRKILVQVLEILPEAKVRIPRAEEFVEYVWVVKERHQRNVGELRCVLAMDSPRS